MTALCVTRDTALTAAAAHWARMKRDFATRTPRESALAAHVPGGPSVEELERRICARLGIPDTTADRAA